MKKLFLPIFSIMCSLQALASISPLNEVEISEFKSEDETLSVVFERLSKAWELNAPYKINFSFSPPSIGEIESSPFSYRNLRFERVLQFVTNQHNLEYGIDRTNEKLEGSLSYMIYKPIEVKEIEVWMQSSPRPDPFTPVSASNASVPVTIAQAIEDDEASRSLSYLYIRNRNGDWTGLHAVSRLKQYFKDLAPSKSIQDSGDAFTVLYRLETDIGSIYITFDNTGWKLLNIGDDVIWQDKGDYSHRNNALRWFSASLYGLLPSWFVERNDLKQDFRLISPD